MDLQSLSLMMARSENLPTLPKVVTQIIALAEDPNTGARDMERLIERDPAIMAKVLKVANSPYYGMRKVSSIAQAVSVLGMNTVRSLVVGVGFQQMMGQRESARNFSKAELWKHSLATALSSRVIGKLKLPASAEELYCAGMMHDIGLLVMDRFVPSKLDMAIKMAQEEGYQLFMAEQLIFDYDHTTIGALLTDKWGMGGLLREAVAHHHDFACEEEYMLPVCIVSLANVMAYKAGFKNCTPNIDIDYDPMALQVVGIPVEQLPIIEGVVAEEVHKAEDQFGLQSAA